jgi:hypothetical protein
VNSSLTSPHLGERNVQVDNLSETPGRGESGQLVKERQSQGTGAGRAWVTAQLHQSLLCDLG